MVIVYFLYVDQGFYCFFFTSRWESHRAGCGPPAGAEGAGRSVHLSSEACGSLSQQRQDFLDCEWNAQPLASRGRRTLAPETRRPSTLIIAILLPSFSSLSSKVTHQSRYIQGYRIFYRTIGSPWSVLDVEATSEHAATLVDLHASTEYEVKIRPYFNELQGRDSLMVLLRTPEEGEEWVNVLDSEGRLMMICSDVTYKKKVSWPFWRTLFLSLIMLIKMQSS